jgi:hypothetical protein
MKSGNNMRAMNWTKNKNYKLRFSEQIGEWYVQEKSTTGWKKLMVLNPAGQTAFACSYVA